MRRQASVGALLIVLLPLPGGSAIAQRELRDQSVENLPRPGYEPKRIRLGQTVIAPEVLVGAQYDDNILAAETNKVDDIIVSLSPSVAISHDDGKFRLNSSLFGTFRRYVDNKSENVNTYGITGETRYAVSQENTLTANAGLLRTFQRRSDPESDINFTRRPSKIDISRAELGYQYRPNRIGFGVKAGVDRVNYLAAADADRDITSYRGSARVSVRASSRIDAFVEGYAVRRDSRTPTDFSGVNRDTITRGILAGTALDIADRWKGEIGVGVFRSNPSDPALRSFSGFAANGSLTWRPRVRTAVTAEIFRGDVATIRAGANGRVDTRASLRVDQEVRHNFLLGGALSLRDTSYRGVDRNLKQRSAELEATYLVNRHIAVIASTDYTKRTASIPTDEFNRFSFQLATRFVY